MKARTSSKFENNLTKLFEARTSAFSAKFIWHFCYDVKLCTSAAIEILEKKDAQATAETNGTIKMAVGALSCKKLSGQFSTSSN